MVPGSWREIPIIAKIGSWTRRAVGVEKLSIISRERKPGEDEKRL